VDPNGREGVVRFGKFDYKNVIKHENCRPPRFSDNHKYLLKGISPNPNPSGFPTTVHLGTCK
jgi:hypothetical protein